MKRTPLTPPPLPDYEGIKKKRQKLKELLEQRPDLWPAIIDRCKRSFEFWAEHFCWIYDEHTKGQNKERELCLWDIQKEVSAETIINLFKCADEENYRWNSAEDKPRKIGATFLKLLIAQWIAQFHGLSTILTSKDEESVDIIGNMDSPFEKLRFQIERQPKELLPPEFDITNKKYYKSKLVNFRNGGQITGISPTSKKMRQVRALWWIADEWGFVDDDWAVWAAASGAVKAKSAISTPNGTNCHFYFLIHQDELEPEDRENVHVFEIHWYDNPEYAKGLYRKADGTISSPYFDSVVANNTKQVVAREYLLDHGDSVGGKVYFMFRKNSIFDELEPDRDVKTIFRCWDPGLWFAVTFGQKDSDGGFRKLYEIAMNRERISNAKTLTRTIAEEALKVAENEFAAYEIYDIGDPYGAKIQTPNQEETEFETLKKYYDIRVQSAFLKNMPTHTRVTKRHELMGNLMIQDIELADGTMRPLIQVNKRRCPITIQGYQSKYRYVVEKDGTVTDKIKETRPVNDLMDCWGYMALRLFDRPPSDEPFKIKKAEPTQWKRTERRFSGGGITMSWSRSGRMR